MKLYLLWLLSRLPAGRQGKVPYLDGRQQAVGRWPLFYEKVNAIASIVYDTLSVDSIIADSSDQ